MRKAQNIVEISLLACLVVVIAIASMSMYNNQKLRLAKDSSVELHSVDLTKMKEDAATAGQTLPYHKAVAVETAGTNALEGMSSSAIETAISKLTYEDLAKAMDGGDNTDIAKLGNSLIDSLKLSDCDLISKEGVTPSTLTDLIKILNAAAKSPNIKNTDSTEYKFVQRFKALLNSASGS